MFYGNNLSLYLRYRKLDSCDHLLEGDPRLIQSQIIDYIIYLREELKLSQATINSRVSSIKKFYDCNEIELKWKKIKSYVGKGGRKFRKDRGYTKIEIAKMLEKAALRCKIANLLMFTAGVRVGAITSIKIRDLEKIDKYNLYKIKVYENDDEEYATFCTPGCASLIDSYLEYRQIHGERPLNEDQR